MRRQSTPPECEHVNTSTRTIENSGGGGGLSVAVPPTLELSGSTFAERLHLVSNDWRSTAEDEALVAVLF